MSRTEVFREFDGWVLSLFEVFRELEWRVL